MLTVADVMTTPVFTIRSSAKVTQAIALMQENEVRSLIVEQVVQGGSYGLITGQDIICKVMAKAADPLHMMVCEIMQSNCTSVEPTMSLLDVSRLFAEKNVQKAPVVCEGKLVGIISTTDIVMKSNVETVELPEGWADEVESALRHKRLCWTDDCQLEAESKTARRVLQELSL